MSGLGAILDLAWPLRVTLILKITEFHNWKNTGRYLVHPPTQSSHSLCSATLATLLKYFQ